MTKGWHTGVPSGATQSALPSPKMYADYQQVMLLGVRGEGSFSLPLYSVHRVHPFCAAKHKRFIKFLAKVLSVRKNVVTLQRKDRQ